MSFFEQHYKKIKIQAPSCHFVLGSGYSLSLDKAVLNVQNWEEREPVFFKDVPQIPTPKVTSHLGLYRFFVHKKSGKAISFQCGRLHLYEDYSASTVVQPVRQIFLSGTKKFILTNISGGLKKEHCPGTVIALKDHVNMQGVSPLIGLDQKDIKGQGLGSLFPDMSQVYDPSIREQVSNEMLSFGLRVVQGVYVGLLGPELETPAQIQWLNTSSQGLFDAVGMSTVLEAIALKQMGALIGGFSLVSNPAAGVDPHYKEISFDDMLHSIESCTVKILEVFFSYSEKQV